MARFSRRDGHLVAQIAAITTASADPRPASDAACALLHQLAPLIAQAVDPLRTVTALGGMVAGVVATGAGGIVPLPGLPDHALLAAGSPVLTLARARLSQGPMHASFLLPVEARDPAARWVRVTAVACPPQPPRHPCAVILLSPPPDLHQLTRRELEVLGLLVEGWSNARIAAALVVAERAVVAHLDRILAKLDAPSRTAAAVRALRQGLYVPAGPGRGAGRQGAAPAGRRTSASAAGTGPAPD
ncbi:MAG TPA: LuxR C-terminal-related transcriptional regulator [Pilimelia sp.]|nr:LuxR C-terminal-related transcriptional regulator [Pilimelia sp.]